MREHEAAIGGEGDVELERVDAELHRAAQPWQGVLRPQAPRSPVTMNLNAHTGDTTWRKAR
ncbi:hypothetical protein GCM10010176_022360 [Nonomuraea spiralis]|nr:hypothetical protein GCM10010176_022360 [Nonomuraea spiralis]